MVNGPLKAIQLNSIVRTDNRSERGDYLFVEGEYSMMRIAKEFIVVINTM